MIVNSTHTMTVDEIIKDPSTCPLRISVIPNKMGINLSSVESLSWTKRSDGQLIDLTIKFIPSEESN